MPKRKASISFVKQLKLSKKTKKEIKLIGNKIIGLVLVVLALALLIYPIKLPGHKTDNKNPIIIDSKLLVSKKTENTPVRIIVPQSEIDLPVTPSKIIDGYWELSETTASYGLGSGYPGEKGNIVIFAHARSGLFYNLRDTKKGDFVYVLVKNKWYMYKVNKIDAVYPNQKEVIMPTKTETLTLYTCTGFYDEKRLVVTAVPAK
jgi:LPXTG-site transpeptidase (sortase) family protein